MSHKGNDDWMEAMHELNPKKSEKEVKGAMDRRKPFKMSKEDVVKKMSSKKDNKEKWAIGGGAHWFEKRVREAKWGKVNKDAPTYLRADRERERRRIANKKKRAPIKHHGIRRSAEEEGENRSDFARGN